MAAGAQARTRTRPTCGRRARSAHACPTGGDGGPGRLRPFPAGAAALGTAVGVAGVRLRGDLRPGAGPGPGVHLSAGRPPDREGEDERLLPGLPRLLLREPRGHPVQLPLPPVCGARTGGGGRRVAVQPGSPAGPAAGAGAPLRLRLLPASPGPLRAERLLPEVCSEIDQWPPPVPGQTLNLPVMGVVIQVRIPSRVDKPGSCPAKPLIQENLLPAPLILPSVAELDLFRCFQSVLVHIQLLWELVLLGEPLVVVAPSPAMSSEMVLALASCLAPLKYCCDFRPYFTIHDNEFKEYTTRTQGPPSVLLGVTNPFFIKMLQHWPHLLRLGELRVAGDLPKQVKLKKLAKLKTLDTKPGLYTSYKAFLHKDKTLIKRLLKGIQKQRPSEAQSALLRRQLLELTQSFIIPLEHYMASLMPLQRSITPWKTPPRIRPFHQEDFLKSLDQAGPQLTCALKGDWLALYRRFFKSPNFDGWFRQRHQEMRQKLEALHLEAIAEANVRAWMVDKSEAEAVDLVLKLREKLVRARSQGLPAREETLQRVCQHIAVVVRSLPKDLQATLRHQEAASAS
ncbi:protein DENND6B isoform X3 [Pseudonaja textilis]|uniref:protein DENND6B isoform X3 n=1 Tax=Pseudonaja textilis TaxID=8673 RepID=UPI000EAA4F16|nr:protein DENND6B isoform X3 [Pseudonaja textilis]